MIKRQIAIALMVVFASACGPKSENGNTGGAEGKTESVIPMPNGVTVSAGQFAQLKWIEGSWRGAAPGGPPFYERYAFVDDSSITMYLYPDSTFRASNDSAHVTLRGGTVRNSGHTASWVASHLDSARVDFEPEWGATASFAWQNEGESWTATIQSGSGNSKTVTVYRMRRIKP